MSNRYGRSFRSGSGNSNGYGNFGSEERDRDRDRDGGGERYRSRDRERDRDRDRNGDDYDPYGDGYGNGNGNGVGNSNDRYGSGSGPSYSNRSMRNAPPRQQQRDRGPETRAQRQIGEVLEHVKAEWPFMFQNDCIPVQMALQLLDNSSVGRAHEYRKFQKTHDFIQTSLKNIVHEHHQGFNSSIGTFHKIQGSIQASQAKVRELKDSLGTSKTSLCTSDPELKKLSKASNIYDELLQALNELEELRTVPDQLEARISEKRFLTAVDVLHTALRKLRKPELDDIGGLGDLRSYLANQETAMMDILVEELHEHLYLKSPYCQERWQSLAKTQGSVNEGVVDSSTITPFHQILDSTDFEVAVAEDPAKNPEADTFYYVGLVVEALNKLGKLETAVETLKQRLPVELFAIVNETINEVDQRHPSSLRGGSQNSQGLHIYGARETQMRADVIYDLLWTLYGKFEAIAEGHRILHESVKALIRREGAGNNSALLGSFKELWNLYQNEIRSLLHNYVTTDADVYQFNSAANVGISINGKTDAAREHLFKFSEADPKAPEMTVEYEALEGIIRAAVPGLTDSSRKADKKASLIANRSALDGISTRKGATTALEAKQPTGSYKSLVEPSVFNMSLLLPPTLVFLQRLKVIVPPGSDLATSTLTSFLDNFLVNVFQPQLDETLGKLGDIIFGESDAFNQERDWSQVARKPIFKGTVAFFTVVTAFCQMLGTIPHDQALSALIITQMMRYYERCFGWYKSLVAKAQEQPSDAQTLRASATMATNGEDGEILETMKKLWTSDTLDRQLLDKEVSLLILETNEKRLQLSDIIQDRDTISALCLLYTSMKWLAVKVSGLRHITKVEEDSSKPNVPRQPGKRWTLMNDPGKATSEQGPVYLPMTQETVRSFDKIVSSYEELAGTAILTLHMEMRCQIIYSLGVALSSETAPYILEQDVTEPDPQILSLNSELVSYDETAARFLRDREVAFIRTGLSMLINDYLVAHAPATAPMNARGCRRMQLNILVLQQNLKNIEEGVDLVRAANYYSLFERGPDAVVDRARAEAARAAGATGAGEADAADVFSYDELKAMVELCYSEQLADPERGVAAAAKRQMADRMLVLSEQMWQS